MIIATPPPLASTTSEQNVVQFLSSHNLAASDASNDELAGVPQDSEMALNQITESNEPLVKTALRLREGLFGERLGDEFSRMLLRSQRPSRGLESLRLAGLLRFFPELEAIVNVPQEPEFHPEGTVWQHTLLVVDGAAKARTGDEEQDLIVMFAALCHDLGKATTTIVEKGRIRSPRHSEEGVKPTESFLGRMRASDDFISKITTLVYYHLAPTLLVADGATPKAYRRLTRKLDEVGLTARHLFLLGRADHFGALAKEYPFGEPFIKAMADFGAGRETERSVVLGRHLKAHGLAPGPGFTPILAKCREIQDETGWEDPERILERALATGDSIPREPVPPPFLLPRTQQSGMVSEMINLPASPTDNDINAIGLLLPGGFKVSLDQGKIIMTVLGGTDHGIPLFSYEIAPGTKQNYEGALLSVLLEDLAKKVSGKLRNTRFESSQTFNDIMNVILPPAQDVLSGHCPKNEYSIRIGKILTTEASDWISYSAAD